MSSTSFWIQYESRDMPSGALSRLAVLDRKPSNVAKIPNFGTYRRQQHQNPLINRIDQDDALAFGLFGYRLSNPCGRPFLLALMNNGSERWVDVIRAAPLACKPVEPFRQREGTWIKIEMELCIKGRVKLWRCYPIVLTVVPIAAMELVFVWSQFALMRGTEKVSHWRVSSLAASVSWRACSWASADTAERCPRSRPAPLAALLARSLRQYLVGQPLARNAVHEGVKPRQRVVFDVAFVEPEGELVNVAAKMLRAGVVIDADQPALENRKDALNAVRGDASAGELAERMVHCVVAEEQPAKIAIGSRFVGVQDRADFSILHDNVLDCLRFRVGQLERLGSAAALAHAKHGRLTDRTASRLQLLVLMLVSLDPADEGFVNLDNALQLLEVGTAGFPQAVQYEPSRLLGDPYFLRKLYRGYALACRDEQVHRVNPLVQGNMAALENRPRAHREVLLALVAAIEAVCPFGDPLAQAADRAARTLRPQPPFEILPRRLLVGKHREQLERRNGALAHGLSLDFCQKSSPEIRGSQVYKSLFNHAFDLLLRLFHRVLAPIRISALASIYSAVRRYNRRTGSLPLCLEWASRPFAWSEPAQCGRLRPSRHARQSNRRCDALVSPNLAGLILGHAPRLHRFAASGAAECADFGRPIGHGQFAAQPSQCPVKHVRASLIAAVAAFYVQYNTAPPLDRRKRGHDLATGLTEHAQAAPHADQLSFANRLHQSLKRFGAAPLDVDLTRLEPGAHEEMLLIRQR